MKTAPGRAQPAAKPSKMVISSFISSVLVLALGIWAYMRLESSMNLFAERQLLIEPSRFSFKMWKDMPVSMYQSFTFFNLTNWSQVKSVGQKPRFVEVGPYVYRTVWSKSDVNFLDDDKLVSFSEKKQWHFQPHLSRGYEDDLIWTINTPLMTALALIQNAPVITRNIVSVILDGLGEGAFIKRPIRSLLFEGYSDLIVSVGPLFDRRFANFNGKFAYLYNKNDTVDGHWTVSTGQDDLAMLNKITRFQSSIVNMTSFSSGQMPQGLNEVKPECAPAWSLDQSTNGQLFAPFNRDLEQARLQRQLQQLKARAMDKQQAQPQQVELQQSPAGSRLSQLTALGSRPGDSIVQAPKRFFSRISSSVGAPPAQAAASPSAQTDHHQHHQHHSNNHQQHSANTQQAAGSAQEKLAQQLRDFGKYIFYPDLCRPIHLLPAKQLVTSDNGIEASRYVIDPRVFMNSSQLATNKCYEMNPRPPLANALAATINSVTGANVNVPNLVTSASSPFALFIPPNGNHHHHNHHHQHDGATASGAGGLGVGLFERANNPSSFLNNALHSLSATANQAADQLASSSSSSPISRLGRVRQLFSNIVSQRMSANPLLPSLAAGPASLLMGANNHHPLQLAARSAAGHPDQQGLGPDGLLLGASPLSRQGHAGQDQGQAGGLSPLAGNNLDTFAGGASQAAALEAGASQPTLVTQPPVVAPPQAPLGGSDRWVTQFRFKWPRGVFSIGQCQLGAPIYVSQPHFLDADEYYLEQVEGLRPNRSLHEFYIDVESTLHSIPVSAKARLQLNVATPELRFRNIPNAMIPVLWQEVTFKIDKPIATMLYWSFTMSGTIYRCVAVALIATGLGLLVYSFVGGFRSRRRQQGRLLDTAGGRVEPGGSRRAARRLALDRRDRASSTSGSQLSDITGESVAHQPAQTGRRGGYPLPVQRDDAVQSGALVRQQAEGRRSSWQHMVLQGAGKHCTLRRGARNELPPHQQHRAHPFRPPATGAAAAAADLLDELHRGASLNRAYASSCNEIHLNRRPDSSDRAGSDESITTNQNSLSPHKQPAWSRASSHCELVSSFGTITKGAPACNGCLFACLRHSPGAGHRGGCLGAGHEEQSLVTDSSDISNRLVRHQQCAAAPLAATAASTASDTEKATLSSSRSSNLDSCSSIYTARAGRKFRP